MSPLTLALIEAAIQAVADILSKMSSGQISEAQAQDYLQAAVNHYNTSVDAWNQAHPKQGA